MYAKRNVPKQTSTIKATGSLIAVTANRLQHFSRAHEKAPRREAAGSALYRGSDGTTWGLPPRPCATT
jgi:hypothetical protein